MPRSLSYLSLELMGLINLVKVMPLYKSGP